MHVCTVACSTSMGFPEMQKTVRSDACNQPATQHHNGVTYMKIQLNDCLTDNSKRLQGTPDPEVVNEPTNKDVTLSYAQHVKADPFKWKFVNGCEEMSATLQYDHLPKDMKTTRSRLSVIHHDRDKHYVQLNLKNALPERVYRQSFSPAIALAIRYGDAICIDALSDLLTERFWLRIISVQFSITECDADSFRNGNNHPLKNYNSTVPRHTGDTDSQLRISPSDATNGLAFIRKSMQRIAGSSYAIKRAS
ncbi:hypothetical protein CSKR_108139 [Clonorchis sinensis]|nr:hypothetical protein CSKR_108139 [Clonorchis sinensis]